MAIRGSWRCPLLLLLLLVGLLADAAGACGRDDRCFVNVVRGCGECPPNRNNSTGPSMADLAGIGHICGMGDSVVATTFTDIRRLGDAGYLMLLEMPGVGISDVKVEVLPGGILSIAGLSQEQWEPRYHWERGAFTKLFARKFLLPPHVDAQGISHQLQDGLLRVTLPILPGRGGEASSIPDPPGRGEAIPTASSTPILNLPREASWTPIPPGEASLVQEADPTEPQLIFAHIYCSVERADELVQPQALVGLNKPGCNLGDWCQVTISRPLVDMLRREDNKVLLTVVEMPGVKSAEVKVDCRPGRGLRGSRGYPYPDRSIPVEGGTPGCFVSVRGVVEDEDEGELVRAERGGARRKVFERVLYVTPPDSVEAPVNSGVYKLTDGLLKVPLRRVPPPLWDSVVDSLDSGLEHLYNFLYEFSVVDSVASGLEHLYNFL